MKKKILYICSEASSGMIPFAANIINAAAKSPHLEVYAITVSSDSLSYQTYINEAIIKRVSSLHEYKNKLIKYREKIFALAIKREVKKICHTEKIDIIHFLTGDYTCNLIIPYLKRLADIYYTVHDLEPHNTAKKSIKERIIDNYIKIGIQRNIKNSNNLVTCSKNQYEQLKNLFPQKQIFFQPFPSLITQEIAEGSDVCPEIKNKTDYILFFGNIDKYKGVEYLHNAFTKNEYLSSKYQLVIAGSGKIYFQHDKNDSRIIYINRYIKDSEIKCLFNNAACVVYPYISATQSGVLSLAYRFQTPVITSDIPFFRENSTTESCLFFEVGNSNDLSDKLENLLFKSDLNDMKQKQYDLYKNLYSEESIIMALEKIYLQS